MKIPSVAAALLFCCPLVHGIGNGFSFTSDPVAPESIEPRFEPVLGCHEMEGGLKPAIHAVQPLALWPVLDGRGGCTLSGTLRGNVEFIIDLPARWNGRLYMHGNGGYAGESVHGDFGRALRERAVQQGFAAAFTNTGHDAKQQPGAIFALNDREAEIDYSHRALHDTVLVAKQVLRVYYGRNVLHSYFDGCSTGGGQGLKAALRHPGDFDGIAAGAPVFDWIGLQLYGWNNQSAIRDVSFDAAKVERLGRIILEKFDAMDGLRDGVIDDPRAVDFRPARDLPRGAEGFTDAEIAALERLYGGIEISGVHYPGIPPGGELPGLAYRVGSDAASSLQSAWASRIYPDDTGYFQQRDNVETWLRYLAFERDVPDMTLEQFEPARDLPELRAMAELLGAESTDLGAFRRRGGRLLMYHGWADIGVNPLLTVNYYERVVAEQGGEATRGFFRLYMVPGMFHCRGGVNVDRFDAMLPLMRWVEHGAAPERIEAQRIENGRVTRSRPLCPFPEVARLLDGGNADDAEGFECRGRTVESGK